MEQKLLCVVWDPNHGHSRLDHYGLLAWKKAIIEGLGAHDVSSSAHTEKSFIDGKLKLPLGGAQARYRISSLPSESREMEQTLLGTYK